MADDWRLSGQDRYLRGAQFRWCAYKAPSPSWNHDHCEFCSAELAGVGSNVLHEGWQTEDGYRWVCDGCFQDFRGSLGFEVATGSSAPRGIEFHDARLQDVQQAHGQVTVSLDAFVHDNIASDSFAGAWQRIDVQLGEGHLQANRRGDGVVLDGRIQVASEVAENLVPLPFHRIGETTLTLSGTDLLLEVRAQRVWFVIAGPPRDRED
jgi:hypothetical protein